MVNTLIRTIFVLAVLTASAVGFAHAQSRRVAPTPTPTPVVEDTEKVVTEEIKLNVIAFDEDGKFVSGVKENDLVITENNILHQASSVRRIPANVLIVMDTGGELRQIKSLQKTRDTARGLVDSLRESDSIAILQYSDRAEIVGEWTTDKTQAVRAIDRTSFGRRSAFVEALQLAKDFLDKNPRENKHLVLITDGTDSNGNTSAKAEVFRSLLASDISVHVLSYARMEAADLEPRTKGITKSPPPKAMPDEVAAQLPNGVRDVATAPKARTINLDRTLLRKLKARKADLESSEQQLESLAEKTNGTAVIPDNPDEMLAKTALVAKMIDSGYVVTYTPKIELNRSTGERNIEVTSKRPGLIVQAKRKIVIDSGQ